MTIGSWRRIGHDESGKAPLKLVFGTCLVATAFAISSPAFQANPLFGRTIVKMGTKIPETFDQIRRALGGQ